MKPHATPAPRSAALDALRGFAILTMALSGMIPFGAQPGWDATLPAWMYHAQLPPPTHKFNPAVVGLTWVDLVFPFFLFSMGAAIPLALGPRLAAGAAPRGLMLAALRRGGSLLLFAVYVEHLNPWRMASQPGAATWWQALLGFALLFPALTRLPQRWPLAIRAAVRLAGWAGCAAWLAVQPFADGGGFSLLRADIIIVVLANVVASASIIWIATRESPATRLVVMLGLIALRLAHEDGGVLRLLWSWPLAGASPEWRALAEPVQPYLAKYLQLYYQQYLLIVLPGTFAGDVLRHAPSVLAASLDEPRRARCGWQAVLAIGLIVGVLTGLQARWLPWTGVATLAMLAAMRPLFVGSRRNPPIEPPAAEIAALFRWAAAWLLLGLLLESYEGGIRKDPHTLSYLFTTAGLAGFALLAFVALLEGCRVQRPFGLLVVCGRNPMLAYAGIRGLVPPLVHLTGLETLGQRLLASPWLGVVRGVLKTLLLAALTALFTRLRWLWRT